jgi:PKD repeat protein
MKKFSLKRLGSKLVLLAMLAVPELASAQLFNYNPTGDVLAGFRKTSPEGLYELVVDLGNVTNFLNLSIGTTINITNYSTSQMTNAFTDTGSFGNLQWSVFAAATGGGLNANSNPWTTPLGTFPRDTLWYTQPAPNATTQSQVPSRQSYETQGSTYNLIHGVAGPTGGATYISTSLAVSNVNNNPFLVREPVSSYPSYILTYYIGDSINTAIGDFGSGGTPLANSIENTNPASFTSPVRDDFYQLCPSALTDPINSSTTNTYYLGYFLMYPNGSMTFTRAAQSVVTQPPSAGFSGSPTNGFAPLQVVFTDASTGSITNWVWSFGDGQSVTNTSNASVNHTYAASGSYTVTLTVSGAGGANADAQSSYVVVSSTPTISTVTKSGGNLVMGGTGNPAGTQYRILTSTNLALPVSSWTPVTTNVFLLDGSYSYTISTAQNAAFFRLVSP